ncbi:hypothetical protein Tco_0666746 [Tanacetum coccineum]
MIHGDPNAVRRDLFREFQNYSGINVASAFRSNPFLRQIVDCHENNLFPDIGRRNGPIKSIAPNVKDFTNLDEFEASLHVSEVFFLTLARVTFLRPNSCASLRWWARRNRSQRSFGLLRFLQHDVPPLGHCAS